MQLSIGTSTPINYYEEIPLNKLLGHIERYAKYIEQQKNTHKSN